MSHVKKNCEILEKIFELENEDKNLADNYAKEMLYGANSIDLDSQRYFEQILINFSKKKEIIIPKINSGRKNKYLYFDINKNWKSIWDIIFLGEIISEEIILNLDIKVDYNEKIEKEVIIENLPIGVKSKHIEKLKHSIRLIQKIKDSISHKENYNVCEEIIENDKRYVRIENLRGEIPFKGKILLNYLEGFINNKIIPLQEDIKIAKNTDKIAYPLLEELGYNPTKIQNFFYRVNPTLLEYILDKINNDYTKLYQLPARIYNLDINELQKILSHPKVESIVSLSGLPPIAFDELQKTYELLKNVDKIEDLVGVCEEIFFDVSLAYELLKHPKVKSLDSLKRIPIEFFYNKEKMFDLLNHPKVEKVEDFVGFPSEAFNLSERLLKLLNHPKVERINDLKDLPQGAYWNIKLTEKMLKNHTTKNKLFEMKDIEFVYLKKIKKLLKHPKVESIESLSVLSPKQIYYHKILLKLLDHPKVESIESLAKINSLYFEDSNLFIKLLNHPKVNRVEDLNEVSCAIKFDETGKLLQIVQNIQMLNGIPADAFKNSNFTLELLKHPKVESIESFQYLPDIVFANSKNTLKLLEHPKVKKIENFIGLSEGIFEYVDITLKLLNNSKIDSIERLKGLPFEFFSHFSEIEKIYKKYDYLMIEIFKNIPIRLYEKVKIGSTEIFEKTSFESYEKIKLNNLEKLLNRVDNNFERLSEFPDEFFSCDDNVLEKLLSTYSINISKSIFGTYNPKTIYLISYMHTVLTKHNFTKFGENESQKYSTIDLKFFDNATYIDSDKRVNFHNYFKQKININKKKYDNIVKYLNNIKNIKEVELLNQANQKSVEMIDELKENLLKQKGKNICSILGHLRNACSHFYFEELASSKFIRIYDINEEGKKNFDAIFETENLYKLIKVVENIDSLNKVTIEFLIKQLNLIEIEELMQTYKSIIENKNSKNSLNQQLIENLKLYLNSINKDYELTEEKHNKK